MKKREVKLAPNRDASSEPVIEVSFKLRQTNGWEVYNESGESEVCSATFMLYSNAHAEESALPACVNMHEVYKCILLYVQ